MPRAPGHQVPACCPYPGTWARHSPPLTLGGSLSCPLWPSLCLPFPLVHSCAGHGDATGHVVGSVCCAHSAVAPSSGKCVPGVEAAIHGPSAWLGVALRVLCSFLPPLVLSGGLLCHELTTARPRPSRSQALGPQVRGLCRGCPGFRRDRRFLPWERSPSSALVPSPDSVQPASAGWRLSPTRS